LGLALNTVTVPGAAVVNDRLADDNTIEIGLGIHGEAGLRQSSMMTADKMATEMISTIQAYGRVEDEDNGENQTIVPFVKAGDHVVILVNNLGGTSNFEMSILARSCIRTLEGPEYMVKVCRVLVGSYMTSFDMHGASLTILNVTGHTLDWLHYLDAHTTAPAWSKCDVWNTETPRPSAVAVPDVATTTSMTTGQLPPCSIPDFSATATKVVTAAVTALAEAEPLLTKYDTVVGDGDCGLTMKRGATKILQELQQGTLNTQHPVTLFADLSRAVSDSMGGTSGILLELLLGKMASTLSSAHTKDTSTSITASSLAQAFSRGVEAVQLYGGATLGSRTMLDAMIPAAQAWTSGDAGGTTNILSAAQAARQGANGTAAMDTASAGRSNYLSQESLQGTPDPGAIAVAIVLEACAAAAAP
jgi:dihydroxyacetone kinase